MRKIVWWASKKSSVGCENGIEAQFGYHIRRKELRKLHKAASEGDVARVQHLCLLKKSSVNDRDRNNRTALHLACASGHSEVVMLLLERKCMINVTDNDNMTPLMKAVQSHEEKCARILLNHGADPNIIDENGNTALHYAAYCENVGIAKQLLLRSADIEVRNKDGFTPLLLAIYENGEEIAEFLIKKGANIHAVDKIKRTALMLAAQYRSTRIVRLLLEKGIDASCLNMYGWPAEKFALVTFNLANRQLILDYEDEHRYKMLEKNNPGMKDPSFIWSTSSFRQAKAHVNKPPQELQAIDTKHRCVKLNDGHFIPVLGFGTYAPEEVPKSEALKATKLAIDAGFCHIDSAYLYKNEEEVGLSITSKIADGVVKRQDIFCTSEPGGELIPKDDHGKVLFDTVDLCATWEATEECKDSGLTKSIEVSNFNRRQMEMILNKPGLKYKPVCNQAISKELELKWSSWEWDQYQYHMERGCCRWWCHFYATTWPRF